MTPVPITFSLCRKAKPSLAPLSRKGKNVMQVSKQLWVRTFAGDVGRHAGPAGSHAGTPWKIVRICH